MGDIQDLQQGEAIEKIKKLAEGTVGHFCQLHGRFCGYSTTYAHAGG